MTLTSGTMLGHYEIRALIGVGGMGEVYRAYDTVLTRDVALKLLPEAFARDPDRVARFKREARLLASLNHPNIAAIYGLEEDKGTHFLVMELVEGDTLRDRITRDGAVPLEETLSIGKQIAEALEAAHEKPIIHRDLKPANIKLTPEGKVKVLDFGLAKAFAESQSATDIENAPTLTASPTIPGAILGTPAYMSPEQAKGKKADRRADIWALGCVLYELLTGQGAFHRNPSRARQQAVASPAMSQPLPHGRGSDDPDTVQEILARVLQADPDWTALPETTPHGIRVLLRRCLHKDVTRRFHAAADVRIEIEEALAAPPPPAPIPAPPAIPAKPRWQQALPWAVGFLLGAIAVSIAVWTLRPAAAPQLVSRSVIPLPPGAALTGNTVMNLALSPDGTHLAYVASGSGGTQQLYLRAIESLEARPVPGTGGAVNPFFSPDGQWIGFSVGGKLMKVSVSGGATLTLCDAPNSRGAAWGANDTIVFAPSSNGGLSQVSAAGGAPQALTTLKEGESSHRWPQFLPDGKTILFTAGTGSVFNFDDANIAAVRLDTREHQVLIRGGTYARYVPTGHLVYYRAGTIMAVPFDPVRLEVKGTPAPVLEGVMGGIGSGGGAAQFSFSDRGSLVYVPGGPQVLEPLSLVWVDRKGAAQPLPAPHRAYSNPRLSPDGRLVALNIFDPGKEDIWIYGLARDTLTRLSFEGTLNTFPLWTPDGKRVAYRSQRGGVSNLFWKPADGSGPEERLTTSEYLHMALSFSPDGRTLVYAEQNPKTNFDLWALPLEGDPSTSSGQGRKPRLVLQTPFNERVARLSPDGRWLAYISDESGRYEVYVQPFPGPGGKYQISTEGGSEIFWAQKGELFYRTGANREKMMAVDTRTQPGFSAGKPRLLFEGPYASNAPATWGPNYSVSADGQRFLMLQAQEQPQAAAQIHVVLNWFEELKRRVPSGQ